MLPESSGFSNPKRVAMPEKMGIAYAVTTIGVVRQ
jgi:hypothetical protein